MKAKKARTFLYFLFLIFCYLQYILFNKMGYDMSKAWVMIWHNIVIEPGKSKKSFQRSFNLHQKPFDQNSPISQRLFWSFFIKISLNSSKPYDFIGAELFMHWVANACVSLSSEWETATAKYVGGNKLIWEILIKMAPFHGIYATQAWQGMASDRAHTSAHT